MKSFLLLIDHRDSFTYNIAHALETIGHAVQILPASKLSLSDLNNHIPAGIILGPGPGHPKSAALALELLRAQLPVPILGICLGHQCLALAFGGKVKRALCPMHGKRSSVVHQETALFNRVPKEFKAMRYHSLVIDPTVIPNCLKVTAVTKEGEIMAVEHRELPYCGVQFHPDSFLCEGGLQLFLNWTSYHLRASKLLKQLKA